MTVAQKTNRKQQILECLAKMLETCPGQRITTAKLAAEVGVSEAALYRHFPSKARMFEGLIDFIEESTFSRVNLILSDHKEALVRCHHILHVLLVFSERNPGMCRILAGDALMGENERLRARVNQYFEKLETQFKQVLRERKLREGKGFSISEQALANILGAFVEGKISQYVRSGFTKKPSEDFNDQWQFLMAGK
ncbi:MULTISPECIES: nucleoid occlusion factor SlmA [unclassified Colwellia]|uniref:nucleoid occlusion factor SlmA n=1 Tax=unclassified Colwellia TaxID=196834 RepID=UPI0015F368BC|nr:MULTISPECIES: nucleoid occlusion factor SlmA [unclassified Colwellia]MBA6231169.1 nucleoid occlusion factor SlmA [Colwellia sp. MB02u-7]MBA6235062.1 nucleoid occlusion factor SlmA [Colwellia sp. MB02u-11]MBA6257554.1 nucleoid occlusion factor SlmA [Colwellia sp. MB3u-28]MBA6260626.1 nucleoid occlusion factor SlmA [Colwellia sp. MB3u-41]MBA6301729.1 nucleoid occlusion factor SlmA [Colwellia sp. MB3u-22]